MTRRASQIIRIADPQAIVVCPSMGQLWEPQAQQKLQHFAELGGYQYCDVAGIKLYPRSVSDPPESMLELVSTIDKTLHRSGAHPPLWNTGTTYNVTLEKPLDDEQASTYAVRFSLTGLYAHDLNVQRMYFYSWGSSARVPVVLQAEGGAPTQAALDVEQLQNWLDHALIRSRGHGPAIQLPAHVWQCTFTIATPNDPPHTAVIRWTDHGTAATAAGPRAVAVRHLDGTTQDTNATATVTVSERPVLITYQEN
ncbi:MAG: hypothetical protein ACRDTH_26355 [Pseudonocardiaceae bacterium]